MVNGKPEGYWECDRNDGTKKDQAFLTRANSAEKGLPTKKKEKY
jgi:hypothetical protein